MNGNFMFATIFFKKIFFKVFNLLRYCFCFFMFWFFGCKACGILAPRPGIKPSPPALEGEVLTTGPPGKSLFSNICLEGIFQSKHIFEMLSHYFKIRIPFPAPNSWKTFLSSMDRKIKNMHFKENNSKLKASVYNWAGISAYNFNILVCFQFPLSPLSHLLTSIQFPFAKLRFFIILDPLYFKLTRGGTFYIKQELLFL